MKILSRYILREHVAPFIFAFCTITFLLVIDYVPKIIDQVIDKDLSFGVVIELVALNLAWMLALSVPMSVLVGTLMAFGRLTADFEITAIKTSGINLVRLMVPLLVVAGMITFLMIQFNDKVLPDLNKKARELTSDISVMRPTLVFRPRLFITDVPGYLILLDRIDHATSRVEGVHITEIKNTHQPRVIVAEYGFIKVIQGGRNIQFDLFNGEVHSLDTQDPSDYSKVDFGNQVINVPIDDPELVRRDREYRTDREMPIVQMQTKVEAARSAIAPFRVRIQNQLVDKFVYLFSDTFVSKFPDTASDATAYETTKSDASVLRRHVEKNSQQIGVQKATMDKYDIEIHKKYSIPAASLAFVLIGAPLGVLARRGGMGVPIAISILLFVVYWAFLIGGEDLADRGIVSPFWSMWSANFLLGGIGIYLLTMVVTERPVLSLFRKIE